MFAGLSIDSTRPEDLNGLSRFLTAGFRRGDGAALFAPDCLRWKYFEPCGIDHGPRSFLARAGAEIVGHIGLCPRRFVVRNGTTREVTTLHFVDWLASPDHPSAGLMLMYQGFRSAETQYAVGSSADGARMAGAVGYECRSTLEILGKILDPTYRLRGRADLLKKPARFARDVVRTLLARGRTPAEQVEIRRVQSFGPEVDAVLAHTPAPLALTSRSPELLNYYLRYPLGSVSGWTIHRAGEVIGFALLNVTRDGSSRRGRIVECFLSTRDAGPWHAALISLTGELRNQRADLVTCYASTPWIRSALRSSGFRPFGTQPFYLRDRHHRLEPDLVYHLTQLEADHGYL
jgi:hypothetical protein